MPIYGPPRPLSRPARLALIIGGVVLVAAAIAEGLWMATLPGYSGLGALAGLASLATAGIVLVVFVVRRRRGTAGRCARGPGLPAVSAVALALGVVLTMQLPLRVRWAASRLAFTAVVENLPASDSTEDWQPVEVPARIGGYRIRDADRVRGGIIFYETHGSMLDWAGFAYLPDGPYADLDTGWFESPIFEHLGGPWYAFTASW
jgi:hypothetical protein